MSNFARKILRSQWRSDHPPHFNRTQKRRAAAALNSKLAPRRAYQLYKIEKLDPKRYAAMVELALGKAGAKPDPDGEMIVDSPAALDVIATDLERAAQNGGV